LSSEIHDFLYFHFAFVAQSWWKQVSLD